MQRDCSVVILAAGFSSRMGQPKWLLELNSGMTFLENLLIQYGHFRCKEIVVVVNTNGFEIINASGLKDKYSFQVVLNHHPEKERLYSIQCGLQKIEKSDFVFIHNADNPFAELELLQLLYDKRKHADYAKPVFENRGGHPILISRNIIDEILKVDNYKISLKTFLSDFKCEKVKTENKEIFTNINSESDYLRLLHKTQ